MNHTKTKPARLGSHIVPGLGPVVRSIREEQGLSLADLGDPAALSLFERGLGGLSVPTLFRVADTLGVGVDELRSRAALIR